MELLDLVTLPRQLNLAHPVVWSHPLAQGLVGWWLARREVTGGVRWLDLTGRTHGTLSGFAMTPTATSGWGGTTRPGGHQELRFGGTDDGVTLGNPPHLQLTNTLTIALWFSTAMTTNPTILVGQEALTSAWNLRVNRSAAGDVALCRSATTAIAQTAGGRWAVNTWTHLVYTRPTTGATHAIYLNGVSQSLTTNTSYTYTATGIKTLGTVGATWFTGLLDDVQFYRRALSAAEVMQLYQESRLGYPTRLNWLPIVVVGGPSVPSTWTISVTDALGVGTPAPTVQRIGGSLDTGTVTDALALTSPAVVAVPFVAVPDGLAVLALTTTATVRVALRPFPTDLLVLDSTSTVAAALPLGPVTEVVNLLTTPVLHLPWLTPSVTEALAVESPGSLRLPLLHAATEDALLLVDDPDVRRGVEGILEPELLLETVALETPVFLHLPWLTPETVDALALDTTGLLHVLTLPAMGSSGVVLTDPVDVSRALEGLWEVSGCVETVALDTTVLLHLPWLTLLTTSTLALAEPQTIVAPVLVPDVAETLALDTPVTLRLPWLRPLASSAVRSAEVTVGRLPLLRLLVTDTLALTTTPDVTRSSETLLTPPTRIEPLALGEVTALQLHTSFLTTDEVALGSVGMTTVGMSLFVEERVGLEATSLLISTVYGQSATTVILTEVIAVQSNWIALMQQTALQVGTAVALRGLAVRGVHAAQMQLHTASIPTPVLAQGRGRTPGLWGPTMRGTLRQGQGTEEVLQQADIDDAVLV